MTNCYKASQRDARKGVIKTKKLTKDYHIEAWLIPSPLQVNIIPLNLVRYSCCIHQKKERGHQLSFNSLQMEIRQIYINQHCKSSLADKTSYPQCVFLNLIISSYIIIKTLSWITQYCRGQGNKFDRVFDMNFMLHVNIEQSQINLTSWN